MRDLVTRIRSRPHDAPMPTEYLLDDAADHIQLLETALRKIQEAAAGYIHPERSVTAEQLIDVVLAEVDNRELVKAMRATSEPAHAMVDKGMEKSE